MNNYGQSSFATYSKNTGSSSSSNKYFGQSTNTGDRNTTYKNIGYCPGTPYQQNGKTTIGGVPVKYSFNIF